MKIDILTLFPEMFDGFLNTSIIKRAIDKKLVTVNIINFRDYSLDPHNKVDDTPYGGGGGMVLMCQPIFDCIKAIKNEKSHIIMLTPSGEVYSQQKAKSFVNYEHLIILCGHYEGFDERIKTIIDEEISIGDYILTGGEIPSMVIADSVIRLIEGSISKESLINESFNDNLLDYPTYTKPREYQGLKVPEVLINGNHQEIAKYRLEQRHKITEKQRKDLLNQ